MYIYPRVALRNMGGCVCLLLCLTGCFLDARGDEKIHTFAEHCILHFGRLPFPTSQNTFHAFSPSSLFAPQLSALMNLQQKHVHHSLTPQRGRGAKQRPRALVLRYHSHYSICRLCTRISEGPLMSVHELQLEHVKQHLQTVVNQVMDIYEAILEKITKLNMI